MKQRSKYVDVEASDTESDYSSNYNYHSSTLESNLSDTSPTNNSN